MRISYVIILGTLLSLDASAGDVKPADASRLAWMEGRWGGTKDGIVMEEHWTSPAGGGLVGMHKDVTGDRMISFEHFRIAADGEGHLCYVTSPNGAPPTTFRTIELGAERVVFENKAHDFPQRILYWLDNERRLNARIEGDVDGKPRGEQWVWTKMAEK